MSLRAFLWGSWPIAFLAVFLLLDPIPQAPTFHAFAPSGQVGPIPHAWNVLSNLPFLVAGAIGLRFLARHGGLGARRPEAVFFLGLLLTGIGSAYYHWEPTTATLVWDRLPMTLGFMGFFLALCAHALDRSAADRALPWALAVGVASVIYWAWTEGQGRGDLRAYAVVQFLPLLLVAVLLVRFHPPTLRRAPLWGVPLAYAVAKVFEFTDHALASALPFALTGHALKHVAAAAAGFAFLRALQVPCADEG